MASTPKSSTALAMCAARLHLRPTRSLMISRVMGWAWAPMSSLSTPILSSTGRDGSVRARSSCTVWSSTLVIVNSSLPIRHASLPVERSLGANSSRETRSEMRDASPRIGHLPFRNAGITSCRSCPGRRSSCRSSRTARRRFQAWHRESCRPGPWQEYRLRP